MQNTAVYGSKILLDPEIEEIVQFLDPETAKILPFLDPEIVKIDKQISGCRNHRNGVISGSRNRKNGQQILYNFLSRGPSRHCQSLRFGVLILLTNIRLPNVLW